MEKIIDLVNELWKLKIFSSIITLIVIFMIYKLVIYFLKKSEKNTKFSLFTSKKSKTYIRLLQSIIRYIFIIIAVLIIMQIYGIEVSSVLAGVGIIGIVFGLAIQDWLKDIIRGSSIISDNYFSVGDIVKYNDIEGKLLIIGLKTTKIQDLRTNNIVSIANRNIEQIEIVSNCIYLNIPFPYEVPIKDAEKVVNEICTDIKGIKDIDDCNYMGVNELADSCINYYILVNSNPVHKFQVIRDCKRAILIRMAKNNISVPYQQIDIHSK